MKFDPAAHYLFDLTHQIQLGRIHPNRLRVVLNDGRILGLLCGALIAETFSDLTLLEDQAAQYDLLQTPANIRYECKTQASSKSGKAGSFKLPPSYMIGGSRKICKTQYAVWLANEIDAFILVRREDFPKLEVIAVDKMKFTGKQSVSLQKGFELNAKGRRQIVIP